MTRTENRATTQVPEAATTPPIFIGGTGRCGTSLLGAMMMETPNVFPFLEPEGLHRLFVDYFLRSRVVPYSLFRPLYARRMSRALRYAGQWYRAHDANALDQGLSAAAVCRALDQAFAGCRSRDDYAGRFDRFLDLLLGGFARTCGRRRWCVKQPGYLYEHLDRLYALHPTLRFVHIVRDGRDVVASILEQPWKLSREPGRRFRQAVRLWSRTLEMGHSLEAGVPRDQQLTIRFEDLVADALPTLRRVYDFIEEDLGVPEEHFALRGDGRGNNFDLRKTNVGRHREQLTREQIAVIEDCHGHLLERYGYG